VRAGGAGEQDVAVQRVLHAVAMTAAGRVADVDDVAADVDDAGAIGIVDGAPRGCVRVGVHVVHLLCVGRHVVQSEAEQLMPPPRLTRPGRRLRSNESNQRIALSRPPGRLTDRRT
jgi:hypothetical protein